MTATAHALAGGAIAAATIHHPVLGMSLALMSHPLMDMVPHWDFGKGWRKKTKLNFFIQGVVDLSIGLTGSYLLFGRQISPIYFGLIIFISLLYDLLMTPYWFLNWKFPPFSLAYRFGSWSNSSARLPWGLFNQAVAVILVILVLSLFGKPI